MQLPEARLTIDYRDRCADKLDFKLHTLFA